MTLELQERARVRANDPHVVLHITRSFSAEPTLSALLPQPAMVKELPLAEALRRRPAVDPDLVWASSAGPEDVSLIRSTFPNAALLVSVHRSVYPAYIVDLYDRGADLVVIDEGVRHAAAAATSLLRRRAPLGR